MASSSQREGMRSASLRGHDTRARRPAVRLARKMAVDAAHSDRSCWKKTTPYAPKTNAGHHTTRAAATTATDVACVIRSVMAVTPSRSSAEPPTSLAPMSQDVSELNVLEWRDLADAPSGPDMVHPSRSCPSSLPLCRGCSRSQKGLSGGCDVSSMRFVEGDSGPIVIDLLISSETATAASNLYREHWGDRRVISVICSPQPR
jgi:hypothetical protein